MTHERWRNRFGSARPCERKSLLSTVAGELHTPALGSDHGGNSPGTVPSHVSVWQLGPIVLRSECRQGQGGWGKEVPRAQEAGHPPRPHGHHLPRYPTHLPFPGPDAVMGQGAGLGLF